MPWRNYSTVPGVDVEVDVNNTTGAVTGVRCVNTTRDAHFLRVYDQATNQTLFNAPIPAGYEAYPNKGIIFPPGSTRQNSATAIPAGIIVVKPVINEDTQQPIPGAFYWDVGVEFGRIAAA